jgi:hypothetical protein
MASTKVNKQAYDFCSLELDMDGNGIPMGIIRGFDDISYGDGVEREMQAGTERVPEEATEGVYEANLSMTLFRYQYDALVAHAAQNGLGPYNSEFSLRLSFANKGEPLSRVDIPRFLLSKKSVQAGRSATPIKVQVECTVLGAIYENGVGPFGEKLSDDI